MSDTDCAFCGRPVQTSVDPAGEYCSPGCRAVAGRLDANPPGDDDRSQIGSADDAADTDHLDQRFFHVAGMHSATCESYLEARACAQDGVVDAAASYVTETIRVTYDPAQIDKAELTDALRSAGYRAVAREDTSGESITTVLSRESASPETRALEDMLGWRYITGIVFGSFMLLPYIVVFYPVQLATLLGHNLGPFEGGGLGSGGLLLLPLFFGVTGAVVVFTGLPLLRGAYVSLVTGRPNTDLLATITIVSAFVYSTIALPLGRLDIYFDLTILVAASVVAAIFYESLVKQQAMEHLTDLTISQTAEARVEGPDGTQSVPVGELEAGDRLLVRQGERVPVDGELREGSCTVDESIVTGESLPVTKTAGDELVGGSVVTNGVAHIRAGDPPTSSMDRLTTAVWTVQSATHGLQRRADRLAASIVPALAIVAVLVAGAVAITDGAPFAVLFALLTVFLVGSPWGLALATPLSVASNLQDARDEGIIVFDETVFERLDETDVVVLDKTGTLTTGEMHVVDTAAASDLLTAAATLESLATHPAARAIVDAFESDAASPGPDTVEEFQQHGLGVSGRIEDTEYLVGHPTLFEQEGWQIEESYRTSIDQARADGHLPVLLGRDGHAAGLVVLGDEPRPGWKSLVTGLVDRDVSVVVLTGDDERAATAFADHPAVDQTFAGIPPTGKTETIRRLKGEGHVTMVGDGTNDAPALAEADLGIALGSGTALASDAADIAIADDDLSAVERTFALARSARRRVRQNIGLGLTYNAITIPVAAGGLLNPLLAMAGVVIAGGLVGLNSMRGLDVGRE